MAEAKKMGWLIDCTIAKNKIESIIANTNRHHGAISCPTGWGKSGMIFLDMLYRIQQAQENHEKIILNLCTPIIKLCAQQGIDFLEFLSATTKNNKKPICEHFNIDKNRICIFNNNSADASKIYQNDEEINVISQYGYDCYKLQDLNDYFINDISCNIAIVISCNPSMSKFIDKFKNFTPLKTTIITYLDEAHTISIDNTGIDENTTKIDLENLCRICNNLYLISATNKKNLVEIVNSYNGVNDDSYIFNIIPADAIEDNIICAPIIGFTYTKDGVIDANTCISFMQQVRNANNRIYHKILITCNDIAHMKNLRKSLCVKGYTIFATNSNEGVYMVDNKEDRIKEIDNVKSFIDAIDSYQGNCFVLHCQQLISGIDVPCITDTILSKSNTDNDNTYITIIQTIGRCLRLGKERGVNVENRDKKYANVLFVTTENNTKVADDLSKFVLSYYGAGNLKFTMNFGTNKHTNTNKADLNLYTNEKTIFGTQVYFYNELILKIEAYIKEKCLSHKRWCVLHNLVAEKMLQKDLIFLEQQCNEFINGEIYVTKYVGDKTLKKEIDKLLRKYNLEEMIG